jgi:hypothetical protein
MQARGDDYGNSDKKGSVSQRITFIAAGMTVASQEAHMLSDLLQTLDGDLLSRLAPTFLAKAEALIADPCGQGFVFDNDRSDTDPHDKRS